MEAVSRASRFLPTLGRLYRQRLCAQRWQSMATSSSVDPFQSHLQAKTEAELMELLNRDQQSAPEPHSADDTEEVSQAWHGY